MSDSVERWLWITPEIAANLTTGALKYSSELARAVAATGVEVTMVGVVRQVGPERRSLPAADSVIYETIDASFRPPWQSLGSSLPNQSFACSVPAVRSAGRSSCSTHVEWNVVVIDGLQAAWVTPALEQRPTRRSDRLPRAQPREQHAT